MSRFRIPSTPWLRLALVVPFLAVLVVLVWWRGPNWSQVGDAFSVVTWPLVFAAIGLNLVSVLVRAIAWRTVITAAVAEPHPKFRLVFSAFSIGLFANAVLPGRIGELARVAVLTRKVGRPGVWASLIGTVLAHRIFDLLPSVLLVVYVLLTAKIPHWALLSVLIVFGVGLTLLAFGLATARLHDRSAVEGLGPVRRFVTMGRQGLGVLHSPGHAAVAALFQCLGWLCQFFAVFTAMRAFHIHSPLPAAGLVLVLMNVATLFPLWPGNVGVLQIAIAVPLTSYGVAYAHGIAFGFGLQAIEASVGVGVGLVFLAREGLSFAMLRRMPGAEQVELPEPASMEVERAERARIPG